MSTRNGPAGTDKNFYGASIVCEFGPMMFEECIEVYRSGYPDECRAMDSHNICKRAKSQPSIACLLA